MKKKPKQQGMALIVSLVIVSLSLMIGVSAFQSAHLEEVSAGTQRASSSSLMAAEFGASQKIQEFTPGDLAVMNSCGGSVSSSDYSDFQSVSNEQNSTVGYRYYWCKSTTDDTITLLVKGVAGGIERTIKAVYIMPDGFVLPPINLPAPINSFEAPTSGSLIVQGLANSSVDGGYYPAITTDGQRDTVVDAIQDKKLDNYFGDISDVIGDSILTDPTKLAMFVYMLKEVAVYEPTVDKNTDLGSVGGGEKIVFTENVDITGNNKSTGAGILIVDGNYGTSGTPDYDGLVIVLGQNFDLTGGGKGGVDGSVIVAPMTMNWDDLYLIDEDGNKVDVNDGVVGKIPVDLCDESIPDPDPKCEVAASFEGITVTSSGGGSASFKHDQTFLDNAFNIMPKEAQDFWKFNNISPYTEPRLDQWEEVDVGGL